MQYWKQADSKNPGDVVCFSQMVDLVDQYANKSLALGWLLVVMRICAINLHAAEINF